MMTDPIADMLTRIRNAVSIERPFVDIPTSHEKEVIAQVLQREARLPRLQKVARAARSSRGNGHQRGVDKPGDPQQSRGADERRRRRSAVLDLLSKPLFLVKPQALYSTEFVTQSLFRRRARLRFRE